MADIDLTDAITALMQHEWEPGHDYSPRSAHTQHGTWDRCAVCRGDVARILEVAAPLLIEQGRRRGVEAAIGYIERMNREASCACVDCIRDDLLAAPPEPAPLSCGCPPEHHDEAKRRLADTMRRDGATAEES